jgi:polysaccharide biosynthesis/export protein
MIPKFLKLLLACASIGLAGCSTFLPTAGPNARQVVEAPQSQPETGIRVVELTQALVRRSLAAQHRASMAETFGTAVAPRSAIGAGDALEVSIWEAPPAALFGSSGLDARGVNSTSRVSVLPEQTVNSAGNINVPFAGAIPAAGRTIEEVEQEITRRLKPKANDPQVVVRMLRNASAVVTVVGEVNTSARIPLSPRGERLLDALAATGGFRQPVGKITIRITRQTLENGRRVAQVVSLPLETIITDPAQNVVLQPGDVVTALYQPNSFTVLGATAKNEEINFEAQGITLAQALGRAGGLQDQRANATAVFLFRFEDPEIVGESAPAHTTADGKVPVIYRADLKDPATFFMAQDFAIRNKDILYVADAPAAELQKFVNLLSGIVTPVLTIRNNNP